MGRMLQNGKKFVLYALRGMLLTKLQKGLQQISDNSPDI
jgi:hypothetical protein